MYAEAIKNQTSAQEFQTRLQAIETVDSNPALKDAWMQQAKLAGVKPTDRHLYEQAAGAGDQRFRNIFEAAQFQTSLGFGKDEARNLAKNGAIPAEASFADINKLVAEVRSNIQGYMPELQAQGINAAKLVKILGNPGGYTAEMDKIRQLAEQRNSLHGRPVVGTYAQSGSGGGLSLYKNDQGQAAYG
jgi:hypothetical protein